MSRWTDLARASQLLGKPILRLDGAEGGGQGQLFYVPDGPQSYVFEFLLEPAIAARSGGYVTTSNPEPKGDVLPADSTGLPVMDAATSSATATTATAEVSSVPSPPLDDTTDGLLGPDVPDPEPANPSANTARVEQQIREGVRELLGQLRNLPPASERLEQGTDHVQRALDLLRVSRYGSAQVELNRARRLLEQQGPP